VSNHRSRPHATGEGLRREFFLLQHIQACREAFQYLRMNSVIAVTGVAMMAIAIALPALMYVVVQNQRALLKEWGDKPSLTIFLQQNLDEPAAIDLLERFATDPSTTAIRFIHRDDAYAEFSQSSGLDLHAGRHPNPLPHVIILTPKAEVWVVDSGAELKRSLESETAVDLVLADLTWIDRLNAISRLTERSVTLLAVLLTCGGFLIVGNTTRALVDEHHKEIEVLRLVGATNSFIRRPFLYSGIIQGLLAGGAALILVQLIFVALHVPITRVAETYLSDFTISSFTPPEVAVLIALSVALGWCGAWIGTSLNLKTFNN